MNTKKLIQPSDSAEFPVDRWVRFSLGDREYIGRALRHERAHLVAAIDTAGKSVTFSWPYICANVLSPVEILGQ